MNQGISKPHSETIIHPFQRELPQITHHFRCPLWSPIQSFAGVPWQTPHKVPEEIGELVLQHDRRNIRRCLFCKDH